MTTRASHRFLKISRFKHSSRSLSWKLSMEAFSHGEPDVMHSAESP